MQEAVKTFQYTAQRGAYLSLVGVFIFICIVEGGATVLLEALLVHLLWLKLTILILTIVSYPYVLIVMLAPLWTRHRLTGTHLQLRYALSLHVNIPLDEISDAQAMRKVVSRIQPFSASYEAKRQRIVACFSDKNLVLLTLAHPMNLKVGWRKRQTTNILLNLDQRDNFLDTLTKAKTSPQAVTTING